MRKSVPLRWIEESEATEVLTGALFERVRPRSFRQAAGAALTDWLTRAHSWLTPRLPTAWPVLQAQPVLVRHTEGLRVRRAPDDEDWHGGLYL